MGNNNNTSECILIESGEKGWALLEYEELYQSALEISNNTEVRKLVFKSTWGRIFHLLRADTLHKKYYFIYSPRSEGNYSNSKSYLRLAILLIIASIKSIKVVFMMCCSSKVYFRKFARLTTSFNQSVVTVLPPSILQRYEPEIVSKGPYLLPISKKTISYLNCFNERNIEQIMASKPLVLLSGNNYGQRKEFFDSVIPLLEDANFEYRLSHRSKTSLRNSSQEYWDELLKSKYIVSTSFMAGSDEDKVSKRIAEYKHLVYRFSEVFSCKRLLLIQKPDECDHLFKPNVHYLAIDNPNEIVDKIIYFETHPDKYIKMVNTAYENYKSKIEIFSPYSLMKSFN